MELRSRVIDIPANIIVLHISGKITSSYLSALEKEFDTFANGPPAKLILDVQNVEAIDSQGVGVLIKGRNDVVNNGGRVVLSGVPQRLWTVLKISGLDSYFDVAPTEFQAIKILEGGG